MRSFLEFLEESSKAPRGTVYHIHEIDHPQGKKAKTYLVAAYHKDAAKDEEGYTSVSLQRHAKEHPKGYTPHHAIGFAILHKDKGNTYRSSMLYTDARWKRQGVATGMYDHARKNKLEVKPSKNQSESGKLFWKGYKQHLKEADIITEVIESYIFESSGYHEVEFVCHNCHYSDSTPRHKQIALHKDLKKIKGVIPLHQNWSDENQTQHSLTAIYQTPKHREAILAAAKKHGVEIDQEQEVSHDYVRRAMRGEHEGQEDIQLKESEIDQDAIPVPGPKYGKLPELQKGEYWSLSGVEQVPLHKIKTIQQHVYAAGVEKYKSGVLSKPARVHIDANGDAYLQDGHHQYTAAVQGGKTHIPAEVWRAKKS